MNDVIIFTEGGKQYGLGHLSRCCALYDELKRHGKNVKFVVSGDDNAKEFLGARKFVFSDWYSCASSFTCEYAVIDSYVADLSVYKEIYGMCKKALYIDDMNRLDYPPGIVLNFAWNAHELPYVQSQNVEYLLGSEYTILRSAFTKPYNRTVRETIRDILVIMGGSDMCNLTPCVLRAVNSAMTGCTMHVVVGSAFNNKKEIKEEVVLSDHLGKNKIICYDNTSDGQLAEIMRNCDIALSAAGQTIYELIATKLPFVAVKIARNQEGNLTSITGAGIISSYIDATIGEFATEEMSCAIMAMHQSKNRLSQVLEMKKYDLCGGTRKIVKSLFSEGNHL